MKKIIVMLFLLFFRTVIFAQENNYNPYNDALKEYLSIYLNFDNKSVNDVYVIENEITDSLIKYVIHKDLKINIIVVNNEEILKGKIKSVIKIVPLKVIIKK